MIEILNRQRKISLAMQSFHEFARRAAEAVERAHGKSFTIAFVSDNTMCALNQEFRGRNATTDVLSFSFEFDEFDFAEHQNLLGDIIISAEQAVRQASENQLSLELEIKQLILHGILHLCGYDHETDAGEMNALELKLRDKLEIS